MFPLETSPHTHPVSEKLPGITSWYSAVMETDGSIVHIPLPTPPENCGIHANEPKETIHYRTYHVPNHPISVACIGGIHGDETVSSDLYIQDILPETNIPHIAIPYANPLAAILGRRGWPEQLPDGSERQIDLNRQFPLTSKNTHFDAPLNRTEPRLISSIIQRFPNLRLLVSIHEDHEFGYDFEPRPGGIYLYDHSPNAENDQNYWIIQDRLGILRNKLKQNNFPLFSGTDDPNDSHLGQTIYQGYVYQPILQENGRLWKNMTLEVFATHLANKGVFPSDFRAITVEIPGGYPIHQKRKALQIIHDNFIAPYVRNKKIIQ